MSIHHTDICLGSNVGPRRQKVLDSVDALKEFCEVRSVGPLVESDDITGRGAPYVNLAVRCTTALGIEEFGAKLHELEVAAGRLPSSKAEGVMPLDADIVVWDGAVVNRRDYNASFFRLTPDA